MQTQGVLLKFGQREHMEALLKDGIIYCNTLHYFAELEDEVGRGDIYENTFKIQSYGKEDKVKLYLRPVDHPDAEPICILPSYFQFRESYNMVDAIGNIFCLYSYEINDFTVDKVNPMNIECDTLGDTVVFIHNAPEFVNRVQKALQEKQLNYKFDFVKYEDLRFYSGKRDYFLKDIKYAPQSEYRIFIKHQANEPFYFAIGSIEEIAIIFPVKSLKNLCYATDSKQLTYFGFYPPQTS